MARKASRTTFRDRFTSSRGLLERSRGFTIVELLIVIVVIAILAAITIVAFNGIQDRAKQSAAQAATKQAATKISAFAIQNADAYPADLNAAGLIDGNSTTYQYRVDNSANPRTFCLTATTQSTSYYVSNSVNTPTSGGCAGHGVNGLAPVTNIAQNPSLETTGNSWAIDTGTGGVSNRTVETSGGASGQRFQRATWKTSATSDARATVETPVATGSYCASIAVRSSINTTVRAFWLNFNGNTFVSTFSPPTSNIVANSWTRIQMGCNQTPPSTTRLVFRIQPTSTGTAPAGLVFDTDALMVSDGATPYAYADGDSPGWMWLGAPQNSSSTGPQL